MTKGHLAALITALVLTLSACGGDAADAPSAVRTADNGDVYNDADVRFATEMIPHHADAVRMVVLADERPLDPAVRQLADAIRDAQVTEVETMVGWLTAWEEEVPETSLDHANAGHGSEYDAGHAEGMEELAAASDADFQRLWLELMIEHHEGALDMAKDQADDGRFKPALRLAQSIESAQKQEIATMEDLLDG